MHAGTSTRSRSLLMALLFCVLAGSGFAQDLDGQQQATLANAMTLLKTAHANINSARGSAGTAASPAKGSRAKLTKLRLGQARAPLDQAGKLLAGLPAGNAAVKAALDQHAQGAAAISQIEGILGGGAKRPTPTGRPQATPPTSTKKPVGAPGPPRLDYKQEKLLKDARFHLNDAKRYWGAAAQTVERLDGGGKKPLHREIKQALASLDRAIPKHNNAVKNLNQLPGAHPDVAAVAKEANASGATMGALRSRLQAEDTKLAKVTGMASYPNYQADFDRVGDFSARYGNFQMTRQQPERFAQIIKEDGQCLEEIRRIAKTYQALAAQRTDAGVKMEKRVLYALERRKQFVAAARDYRKQLPALLAADVAEAEKLADQAVNEKKPLFFGAGSGIEQRLGWAEQKLLVLRAFDENDGKKGDQQLAAARSRIAQREKALEKDIIANNTLPPDRYRGSDRDALIERAKATWAKEQKGAEVLAVRIPSEAWARSTRWQWSGTAWYKVDTSKLQVQLIIKHDDAKAVNRPINIYKNHLKGDTITSFPFDQLKDPLTPRRFILLSKVK